MRRDPRPPSTAGTTHPSARTGDADATQDPVVLWWVHPATHITPLVNKLVFGRDASAGAPLPGHETSRRHAEVDRSAPVPVLRDLQSRNGTWVNGKRITEHPIGPGDVVRIGEWVGVVGELRDETSSLGLRELAAGWYGGARLVRVIEPARRVAPTDLPVIVQGETGTGKEGMAAAIHAWSGRRGAFVAVNTAAIPPAMAEGELFGYRKGAFTGADRSSPGFFRAAHGGTLFLDEILDLPAPLQSKLLRVLEQREVQPLGEPHPVPVDVRVVCATQEPLARAVAERRFRADLLARLDGLTVILPPLRERREDVVALFQLLLARQMGGPPPALDPKLVESLLLYDWPFNVRELVLIVRRLVAVHGAEATFKRGMLPERMLESGVAATTEPRPATTVRSSTSDEGAFEQLVEALRANGGHVARAAAALGITRSRAYRLLEARPEFDVGSLRNGQVS